MVQHFMDAYTPAFFSRTRPHLYYMGKILPEISSYPRIMHAHEEHVEISIITSGTSEYLIRDKMQVIRPGDIIIYNSKTVHDELSSSEVQIGSYFFAIGNLDIPHLRPNALIPDDVDSVFHIEHGFAEILKLCESMLENTAQPDEWSSCIIHYQARALLEIIWRVVYARGDMEKPQYHYEQGKKIKEYIDSHYHEPLSMKTICTDLKLSESYVSHSFKEMLGYSPMQYVMRRKIGEAQTLLISTNYSVTTIARMVGFDAQSHFNQRFIRYVGLSPTKFRKNYRKKNQTEADGES